MTKNGHLISVHETYFGFINRKGWKNRSNFKGSVLDCNSYLSEYQLIWRLLKTTWQLTRGDGVPWIRYFCLSSPQLYNCHVITFAYKYCDYYPSQVLVSVIYSLCVRILVNFSYLKYSFNSVRWVYPLCFVFKCWHRTFHCMNNTNLQYFWMYFSFRFIDYYI